MVADQPKPLFRVEALAVERDDARRLLAAMLQGVQTERGDRRGVGMAEDAEHAAFFAQAIGLGIERLRVLTRRELSGAPGSGPQRAA